MDNPITTGFGAILSGSLVSILTNLGLIFSVGIALGLANKKKAEVAFTALLGYLVFINAMNDVIKKPQKLAFRFLMLGHPAGPVVHERGPA